MTMADSENKSNWKIWVYLTPVYIIIAVPLLMWMNKINSSDVGLSNEEYNVFNASEGEVKKRQQQDIDQAVALWDDYKRRKASTPKGAK